MKVQIGNRLKKLRKEQGFTQKDLAAKVSGGLDYTYIGKIERGEQFPSLKILMKLSETLSVPLGYFFLEENLLKTADGFSPGCKRAGAAPPRQELARAIKMLHDDDVPLVLEIMRVLQRHREDGRRERPEDPAENVLLAAEEKSPYGKT
jgi:transcriptional regulator with XRE-family HTH domain